jgi:hypothetical protein
MLLLVAALLTVGAVVFTLLVRQRDLPVPEPTSPVAHLEERKARIYEGLRDLQFEYRVGKLSEEDYQRTKRELQADLARVLAEIDDILSKGPKPVAVKKAEAAPAPAAVPVRCPSCGATFERPMKFCGECGQPMKGDEA